MSKDKHGPSREELIRKIAGEIDLHYPNVMRAAEAVLDVASKAAHLRRVFEVEAERDALKDVLTTVRALRTVEALAPAIHSFELEKRSEAWARVDEMIEAALKDGGRD